MAKYRPKIKAEIREKLVEETGYKCANPGCPNSRTEIHHIKEWHVYQTHEEQHMVAVCPTCHDAIHHGDLDISDDTVYRWKKIIRDGEKRRGHIYVEPSQEVGILLGSLVLTSPYRAKILNFSPLNKVCFEIVNQEILLFNLNVTSLSGNNVVEIIKNYIVHHKSKEIDYYQVPGKVKIQAPVNDDYITAEMLSKLKKVEPQFGENGKMTIFGMEVVKPGLVRIEGFWADGESGVYVSNDGFTLILAFSDTPLKICGYGEKTIIHYDSHIIDDAFIKFIDGKR